jgi:phage-related protein
MAEIGKAYVQIVPTAKGIKGEIAKELGGETASAGKSAGESFGSNLVGMVKKLIVAAGIGTVLKSAIEEGGKLQQSFGGLDTIYGEASSAAKEYAVQAAAAGISANDYAEQAVSFGASLKQAFGGDTTKAVEAANTAIMDMTDNAAKMGTPIESIQNAYSGFAKQNYTMLDNLKLGYGGTKSEMERLLADAEKLTGVHYDISNLGDVYDAIHAIQGDLGLTGVAAQEASETFSGSFGAMQASAANLLGSLALGEGVAPALTTFIQSVGTFLFNNLIPMIGNIIMSLPTVISTLLTTGIPAILESFMGMFESIKGLFSAESVNSALEVVNGFLAQAPQMITAGTEFLMNLINGIGTQLPQIITKAGEVANKFLESFLTNLPKMLDAGAKSIQQLSSGLAKAIPQVITAAFQVMNQLLNTILSHLPQILQSGVNLIASLAQGLIQNRQAILSAITEGLASLLQTIAQHLPQLLQSGIELIAKLAAGIIQAIPQVISAGLSLINDFKNQFTTVNWGEVGLNIIKGIAAGLKNGAGIIKDAAVSAAKAAFDAAKSFLKIGSPSKLFRNEIGAMMAEGMVLGFEDETPEKRIANDLRAMSNALPGAVGGSSYNYGGFAINVYQAPGQSAEELVDIIEQRIAGRIDSKKAVFG